MELDKVKLEAELEALKGTAEIQVKLARAEEANVSQKALHEKFLEGLQLGQRMAAGGPAFSPAPAPYYRSQAASSGDNMIPACRSSLFDDNSQYQQQSYRPQER